MARRFGYLIVIVAASLGLAALGVGVSLGDGTLPLTDAGELGQGAPSLTPSSTLPPTVTASFTPPPPPPTGTHTPTFTPGPHEHVVQGGETCISIAYNYGHLVPDVIGVIETLNGIKCSSLRSGATLLVPRPTATITPVGMDLTQTAIATAAPPMITLESGPSFSVQKYTVQSDDTLSSIAILHDSSLRQICELNPLPDGIDCNGCQWESENCCCPRAPVFSLGQEINVPAPPPTATPTPTLTGSETPTATPTHRPPQSLLPLSGSEVKGAVRLTWLTVGMLNPDEYYLVQVRDETTGATFSAATQQLSYDVPGAYLPVDGQAHTLVWQVIVVRLGADGFFYPSGVSLPAQRFTWTGWE